MKVLYLTDFSAASEHAYQYLRKLSSHWKEDSVDWIVMHVHQALTPFTAAGEPAMPVTHEEALLEKSKTKLDEIHRQIEQDFKSQKIFEIGGLRDLVHSVCEREDLDFILMGSRKKSNFERITLGGNTSQLMQSVNVPILSIPESTTREKAMEVVITSDLQPMEIENQSLQFLKNWINRNRSSVHVLHIFEEDAKNMNDMVKDTPMHRFLSDVEHQHVTEVNQDVFRGIANYIGNNSPDLLVTIPRDRNFFEKIFHQSISEKLVYHTQLPILILR